MKALTDRARGRETVPGRRRVLRTLAVAGVTSGVFARALSTLASEGATVTTDTIRQAEWIAGLTLTDEQRGLMVRGLNQQVQGFAAMRAVPLDNAIPPALIFDPAAGMKSVQTGTAMSPRRPPAPADRPQSDDDLAFAPVKTLAGMIRAKKVSSVELTRLYLSRLKRLDPKLLCVVTLTEELALRQAKTADEALAAGEWRGQLHGIPWGAKDLLAVPGYKTTWGSVPYREQVRPEKSAVFAKLEVSGAVLVAKTSLGELAWGDEWFGGKTRNPWKLSEGSSGSSAGSAAATAAGCVGFAIGTETWGSIVSPSTQCGTTGLRPTFGRVSRHGAMALAWSMDKIGPIARSVADCALVFAVIHGEDPRDPGTVTRPFEWPVKRPLPKRIGYVKSLFDFDYTKWADEDEDKALYEQWKVRDAATLETLRKLKFELVPIELPSQPAIGPLASILAAEAATAFDDLTRSGRDAQLVRQVDQAWPNTFRQGQMIPAVEYIRANRIRTLLMRAMDDVFKDIEVYVVPSFGGDNLLLTNLTGHPAVVVPNGFRSDGTPTSITFQGRLYGDDMVLAVAQAYQDATDFHTKRPNLEQTT